MSEAVVEIIQYVVRDVVSSGLKAPRIEANRWDEDPRISSAMIYNIEDSTGRGVSVRRDLSRNEQIVVVADQIQEWVIEDTGVARSNWPPCLLHPDNHPLTAMLIGERGVWACPSSKEAIADIGELGSDR